MTYYWGNKPIGGGGGGTGGGVVASRPYWLDSVIALAVRADLPAYTRTENILEADANGAFPNIDDVAPALDKRYLVIDPLGSAHIDHGIFELKALGAVDSKWQLQRVGEMNAGDNASSRIVTVEGGTLYADGIYQCTNDEATASVNVDALAFDKVGKATPGADTDAIHLSVAAEIDSLDEKSEPVGTDLLVIEDSEDSNAKAKIQIASLSTGIPGNDPLFAFNVLSECQFDSQGYGIHKATLFYPQLSAGDTLTFKTDSDEVTYTMVATVGDETGAQDIGIDGGIPYVAEKINSDASNEICTAFVTYQAIVRPDGNPSSPRYLLIIVENTYGDGLRLFGTFSNTNGVMNYGGGDYSDLHFSAVPSSDPGDVQVGQGWEYDEEEGVKRLQYRTVFSQSRYGFDPDNAAFYPLETNRFTPLVQTTWTVPGASGENLFDILSPSQFSGFNILPATLLKFSISGDNPPSVGDQISTKCGGTTRTYTVVANQGAEVAETDVSWEAGVGADFEARFVLRLNADSGRVFEARHFVDASDGNYPFSDFYENRCVLLWGKTKADSKIWMPVNTTPRMQSYYRLCEGREGPSGGGDFGIYMQLPYRPFDWSTSPPHKDTIIPSFEPVSHRFGMFNSRSMEMRSVFVVEHRLRYHASKDESSWIAEAPPQISGTANPNGIVTGLFGQHYRDTASSVTYQCISNPTGTVWDVL